MRLTILIFLTCLAVITAGAAPTLTGTTGLITMPTADSLKYKEYNLASDWLVYSREDISGNAKTELLWLYKANIGAFDGLEIGFVGQSEHEGVFINLKYYLLSDNSEYPLKVALGLNNLSSDYQTASYLVASKRFSDWFAGHFGFNVLLAQETNVSMMLGMQVFFSERLEWLTDIEGEGEYFLTNTALRYYVSDNFLIAVTALNITDQDTSARYSGTTFGLGFTWTDYL